MNGRILSGAWVACLVLCGLAIVLMRREPISATFLACHQVAGYGQAEVMVRNTTSSTIRCYGHLVSSHVGPDERLELRQPFGITLNGKESAHVAVTVPHGDGPVRISCEMMLVDRHYALVRWLGEILKRAGIYIYHGVSPTSPRMQAVAVIGFPQASYALGSVSNLRLQINGTKPVDSLSDYLVFESFTNSWRIP